MARKVRIPKDVAKYLSPAVAASRLVSLAMEMILWQKHGVRIKWSLKISYFHEEGYEEKRLAQPMSCGMSSGEDVPAEIEKQLTGHVRREYVITSDSKKN